jgi:Rrf2 family nitric oxide-sensitive transcriptional repressor
MQLTLFTDYALRTLMYLGAHPGQTVSAAAIGDAFATSSDHLTKAAKWLTQRGYVTATRGKGGGLRLACDPARVRVGALVRETEPHLDLVACFERGSAGCPLDPACKLKHALFEARSAFFAVLDGYTLADLVANRSELVPLLRRAPG